MALIFIIKLLVVIFFLVMFLRGSRLVWGIGLLTVSSAFLLDTVLGTFGREEMQADLGFFYFVVSGALFGGAALWLWGLLRPQMAGDVAQTARLVTPQDKSVTGKNDSPHGAKTESNAVVDRGELYEQIHRRLGPDDVRDLIFDLELNENDVLAPQQEMTQTIQRVMARAESEGKMGALALAVERILTPVPQESLPRREKLGVESPPTVLRHYLLAHYSQQEISDMATELEVDWEQLPHRNKRELARTFLLYLNRRNRLDELIRLLKNPQPAPE
ncbi:MAG: hypothetical protein ACOC8X_06885 [Chloroflexota bacterium]